MLYRQIKISHACECFALYWWTSATHIACELHSYIRTVAYVLTCTYIHKPEAMDSLISNELWSIKYADSCFFHSSIATNKMIIIYS